MKDKRELKDDLSLMQTAYGVALVLAFRNAVEMVYGAFQTAAWSKLDTVKLLAAIALMLTMIRFFWAVGNIRRFILRNQTRLRNTRRYVVSLHFMVLLLHAFALFIICKHTHDTPKDSDPRSTTHFFVFGCAALLSFNALWLLLLTWGQADKMPERTWIRNNSVTAIAMVLVYSIVGYVSSSWFAAFLFTLPVMLANSFVDLIMTSSSYVAVAEEEAPQAAPAPMTAPAS